MDLDPLPSTIPVCAFAETFAKQIHSIYEDVRTRLEKCYALYRAHADKRKHLVGDLVMVYLRKERNRERYPKLQIRCFGHFPIVACFGNNAYEVDLPSEWRNSRSFNVSYLTAFVGDIISTIPLLSEFSEFRLLLLIRLKFAWPPFVMGSIILAILLVMKHLGKSKKYLRFLRAAGPLTAVVLGTAFVKLFHPSSISLVEDIPQGIPKFSIPKRFDYAKSLISTTLLITGVAILESVGIAKALAAKNGYELDSNQEVSIQC
ncbi:Sulfate transporter 4.1-like protein [Thalictrum thalictroides]|uniref:Sulfate transporter 4.1-like protein n=1 Tax=Thalictrum thalictroides TaxID=46969 RepID=A0A7J6UTL2_THATH|nr:Sulfate transporter 4.1-like protein [Thalictrum thalictroides]